MLKNLKNMNQKKGQTKLAFFLIKRNIRDILSILVTSKQDTAC